eukprot:395741-Pyramimonas_sp.AAC.2
MPWSFSIEPSESSPAPNEVKEWTNVVAQAEELQAAREEALQAVCLRVWPLIYAENLLPPSLSSDQAHAAERIKVWPRRAYSDPSK